MASGDPVVRVLAQNVTGTLSAALNVRAGGSSPTEQVKVYQFDAATAEYIDQVCQLIGYGGGGLTFTLPWSAATATTGNVIWEIAIRRIQDDAEDIDTSHTYAYNQVTDAAPTVSGEVVYPTITFTDGADMDSWADGELANVRIRRLAADAGDTMAGDAELWAVMGAET